MPEDWKFLAAQMQDGERPIVRSLLNDYIAVWIEAMNQQPIEHKKANTGRFAANVWLLQEIEAMRHAQPEIVKKYLQVMDQNKIPKLCHTCHHYNQKGVCEKFGMGPPEDFAATPDQCDQWLDEIPF